MHTDIRRFEHETSLNACPACLSQEIKDFVVGVDYHYGIHGSFATTECRLCKTVFINPMPSVADLATLYPNDYYSFQTPTRPRVLKRIIRTFLRYPKVTHVPPFEKPGVMLDVGCGAGHYLVEMREKGWQVFGSELNRAATEAGRKANLDIRPGELTQSGFELKNFDFIRANHSFEHVPNPDIVLQQMHRLLKDDGRVFIGIPNFGGLFPKIFGKYWWNFGLPVHTFNYTESGITAIMTRNGFKVERIIHNSDYSGLTGSLQILANAHLGIKRSDGWVLRNRFLRIPAHYLAKLTDMLGAGDCIEVIASKR